MIMDICLDCGYVHQSVGNWEIIKGECVEGLFYPLRVVARSADV